VGQSDADRLYRMLKTNEGIGVTKRERYRCDGADCQQPAPFHLVDINSRKIIRVWHYCERHFQPDSAYPSRNIVRSSVWPEPEGLIQVELDFLLFDDSQGMGIVQFSDHMKGVGCRMLLSYTDTTILYSHLKDEFGEEVFPPHVLIRCMAECGASLSRVVVDRFDRTKGSYSCSLELELAGRSIHIPIRPPDGYVLAALTGCPFYISEVAIRDGNDSRKK
jgi:hypothetical protein